MIEIIEKLETIPTGVECNITFSDGEEFILKDFERVDESIYGRDDMLIARVVTQIKCDKKFNTPGTIIDFSSKDVMTVDGVSVEELVKN